MDGGARRSLLDPQHGRVTAQQAARNTPPGLLFWSVDVNSRACPPTHHPQASGHCRIAVVAALHQELHSVLQVLLACSTIPFSDYICKMVELPAAVLVRIYAILQCIERTANRPTPGPAATCSTRQIISASWKSALMPAACWSGCPRRGRRGRQWHAPFSRCSSSACSTATGEAATL